jgi:hypothetical protein
VAQLAANLRVAACRSRNNECYYTIDYVVLHSRVVMDAFRFGTADIDEAGSFVSRRNWHFRDLGSGGHSPIQEVHQSEAAVGCGPLTHESNLICGPRSAARDESAEPSFKTGDKLCWGRNGNDPNSALLQKKTADQAQEYRARVRKS